MVTNADITEVTGPRAGGIPSLPGNAPKRQFIPGEGEEAHPALRGSGAAEAYFDQAVADAAASVERRILRAQHGIAERVEAAIPRLKGRSVRETVSLIEMQSPYERDSYLLAEAYANGGRESVLRSFPTVRRSVSDAYERELALRAPAKQSGPEGGKVEDLVVSDPPEVAKETPAKAEAKE